MERRLSEPRPEYAILGFLMRGPMHGYNLYRVFEQELGTVWHMSQSQLYATLKRLATKGWASATGEQGGRQEYTLSDAGREKFTSWLLADSVPSARVIRLEFISRLFFAEYLGLCSAAELAAGQAEAVRGELARHERLLAAQPPGDFFNRLSLDFRLSQLVALEAWLNGLGNRWRSAPSGGYSGLPGSAVPLEDYQ